jgi:neopullulanase
MRILRLMALLLIIISFSQAGFAQKKKGTPVTAPIADCYPTHWWPGMQWNKVQVLVKGKDATFNQNQVSIDYAGVKLEKVTPLENGKYYALDLTISPDANPGTVPINFSSPATKGKKMNVFTIDWALSPRRQGKGVTYAQGVTSADLMYLIMPDRFSNGDPSNDRVPGMRDQSLNRDTVFNRHGGDLQGIINHLGYFVNMGITALWLNPVIENDRPHRTEHGYAFTNHYKIDPRLGGDEKYKELIEKMHARGIKMIQDAVYNHVDLNHFFVIDKPTSDWLNNWPRHTNTTYKDQVLMDPYASNWDKKLMSDGWFTAEMPDLNQKNPYVANFLIQHALWTVEEFGIDAWRIDTYAYNDLDFMNRCNKALLDEYPKMHIFGETWVHGVVNQSFFCENTYDIPYKSNLPAVTDFQTNMYGIIKAVNEPFGWTQGVNSLYNVLVNDFVYKDPMKQVIFLDNHDIPRFWSVVNQDIRKMHVGMAWLLTCRGIPQMYYGMEVLMPGLTTPNDGHVRKDFPGGWEGDTKNAFTGEGLTHQEKEFQDFTKSLALFRKNSSALKTGRMMQYVPEDGLYVYFRYDEKQTVMVVMNTNEKEKEINLNRYQERTRGYLIARDATGTASLDLKRNWTIPGMTCWVMELR